MREIENNLKYELLDLSCSKEIDDWKESKPDYDIDTCAGASVMIEPDDAKTIEEVTSFTVDSDIMGTQSITYEKKGEN